MSPCYLCPPSFSFVGDHVRHFCIFFSNNSSSNFFFISEQFYIYIIISERPPYTLWIYTYTSATSYIIVTVNKPMCGRISVKFILHSDVPSDAINILFPFQALIQMTLNLVYLSQSSSWLCQDSVSVSDFLHFVFLNFAFQFQFTSSIIRFWLWCLCQFGWWLGRYFVECPSTGL